MKLATLVKKAGLELLAQGGQTDPVVADIVYDSRAVTPGALYVSIPGTKVDGDGFIVDAVRRGACAVVSEKPQPQAGVPWVRVAGSRRALGALGRAFWDVDTGRLFTIGITGTNGKTTTAHLYEKLLEQRYGRDKVWMFGTIVYRLGATVVPASHTTPEALAVFRHYGNAAVKPDGVVMEVSSHALALDRISGFQFDLAVWTNLTQDHLDFHGTMEEYYQAKKRLFTSHVKGSGLCAVNIDDPWGARLAGELSSTLTCVTYGRSEGAGYRIVGAECDWDGCRIELRDAAGTARYASSLRGHFNIANMAALCAGARGLGYTPEEIGAALSGMETVPGRMDRVMVDRPFAVIVDYAHTPDALVNILRTARQLTKGKLVCVFGCGGDRDRTKRPRMAAAVAENADEAVITSDNPRSERPGAIIDEILAGVPLDFPHTVIADRREAIRHALETGRDGDCIVIAGKGHESYQEIDGVRHHFDDKEVVRELCAETGKNYVP